MKLGKKLLELRKKIGLSQEALADKLNISRQTISKWELGETSPDISQAKELAEIFKISLDELLDNDITNILEERISNTEKLAAMIMKILKTTGLILLLLLVGFILYYVFFASSYAWFIGDTHIHCSLESKIYDYQIEMETIIEEKPLTRKSITVTNRIADIKRLGGNAYLSSIVDITKYEYFYQLQDAVFAYFYENGGSCEGMS